MIYEYVTHRIISEMKIEGMQENCIFIGYMNAFNFLIIRVLDAKEHRNEFQ